MDHGKDLGPLIEGEEDALGVAGDIVQKQLVGPEHAKELIEWLSAIAEEKPWELPSAKALRALADALLGKQK